MSPASHLKNPALQDSYRIFNQDCELVSQLPKESISNLAGTQPSALFGYCLPAPNQLKHKTLSNGLIDFLVGISHRSDFPRRRTFFVLS